MAKLGLYNIVLRLYNMVLVKRNLTLRIIFSSYVAGGFAIIAFLTSYNNPRFLMKLGDEVFRQNISENVPPYSLGYYVLLFAVPIFVAVLWAPNILSLSGTRNQDSAFSRTVYLFLVFSLVALLCVFLNFGFELGFFGMSLLYGFVFGLIDCLSRSNIEFSFLERDDLPLEVKIAKLESEQHKWADGLSLFTVIFLALAISAGLSAVLAIPSSIRVESVTALTLEFLYVALGIALGIYWNIIQRLNEVSDKLLRIKG